MGRTARMGAALAMAIGATAIAPGPAGAALPPVHNRHALEHAIHQKQGELARVQARAHASYEFWLRVLAHRDRQKQNLLNRFEANLQACEAAAHCGEGRKSHLSEEVERLSGEIQADQTLTAEPQSAAAHHATRALDRAHELEEQIKQREGELQQLPSAAPAVKR
jgi:hypothetical protein